ncbi:MAG: pantoate--beta-alanine ligase [Pseudomonadota bacterium]
MPDKLKTVRTVEALRAQVSQWRRQDMRTALVPTMGALHDGHLRLVEMGLRTADRVVVTIFVNPQQFAPGEDLDAYPRTEKADVAKLRAAGAHLVYAPALLEMYPEEFCTSISLAGPAKADLEDRYRPQFFDGVATVVAKLFISAGCDYAMFGEKDFQQLKVVTRMARDLSIPTGVIGVPTVRAADGLALSSRNEYLSDEERATAPVLHQTLQDVAADVRAGKNIARSCAAGKKRLKQAGFKTDYLEVRVAETLAPVKTKTETELRILAASWLGKTRLIDNIAV